MSTLRAATVSYFCSALDPWHLKSVPDTQHALIQCLLNEVHLKLINLLERQFPPLAKS